MKRRLSGRSLWLTVLIVLLASTTEAAVRQIVLLQSVERGNLVLDRLTAVVRATMHQRLDEPVTFTEFVVNPSGVAATPEQAIADFLRSVFAVQPAPDLVITIGAPAAVFAQKYRAQLFHESPIIHAGTDQRFLQRSTFTSRETMVASDNNPVGALSTILRVLPDTERVFVVMGAGALGRLWREEFDKESRRMDKLVEILWPDGLSYRALMERASTLPPRSAIFFHSYDRDTEGATFATEEVLADLRARANAPIFSGQIAELGHGVVGGNLLDTDALGRTVADVAARILAGASAESLVTPVRAGGPLMFDWREMERWKIPEDRLPAGSIVRFREPGVWARFKWPIIGGVSAIVAQSLLIASLLLSRAKRRRAEVSLRESEQRFRLLADSAPVMIRMSGPDGLATDFNVPWLTFTARTLAEEQGNGWLDGVHPDDVANLAEIRREAYSRRAPHRLEYRLRRADGEYRWMLDSGEPRFSPDGSFAGYIRSAIDITDLKAARATLSNLNRRLMEAQEQERSRVARDLHDDVCQRMALLAVDLDRLSEQIPDSAADVQAQVRNLYEETRSLNEHVNGISHQLHSSKLKIFGLAAAAATFCREISAHHGVAVEFVEEHVPASLPDGVAICLFRVLQEALSNAVKYSDVSRYRVSLRGTDDVLELEVSDEGRGFDPEAAVRTSGLGLVSMQERLRLVDGVLAIESKPGAGTRVRASVPLHAGVAGPPNGTSAADALI